MALLEHPASASGAQLAVGWKLGQVAMWLRPRFKGSGRHECGILYSTQDSLPQTSGCQRYSLFEKSRLGNA